MSGRKDREAQNDELLALSSIFDKNILHITPNYYSGTFNICVRLNGYSTLKITARTKVEGKGSAEGGEEYQLHEHEVSYLPPITLNFRLPDYYPSKAPPKFHMSCCWLSIKQMAILCRQLDDLWTKNRGEVILFTWMQFLQDEALTHLEINDTLDLNLVFPIHQHYKCSSPDAKTAHGANKGFRDGHSSKQPRVNVRGNHHKTGPYRERRLHYMFDKGRIVSTSKNIEDCLSKILIYDKNQKLIDFKSSIYVCEVCFSQYLGSECFRFEECQHIFCKECVKKYFEQLVKQGQVSALSCLADGCSTHASTSQIKAILSQEYFARYDQLLLALTLDSMGDIVYCPRKDCQSPVIKEPDGNVAICPACKFAFCVYCKMSSHGVELCRFKEGEDRKLFELYSTGSEDTKRALERQYGKRQISHLVDTTLAKNWLTQNTKPCPRCKSPIEKRSGCNKMVCCHCQSSFCWICLEIIQDKNPYRHFNAAESSCYGQLFQGDEFEDDEDIEDDIFEDGSDEDDDETEDEDDEDFWDMVVGALAGVIVM